MAVVYPNQFYGFDPDDQVVILEWAERVAPGRYVFSAELVDETTVLLMTSLRPRHEPVLPWVLWKGCSFVDGTDGGIVQRAIYTQELPPRRLLEALVAPDPLRETTSRL